MISETLIKQCPTMERTRKIIKDYGIKIRWIAEKLDIPVKYLSAFLNGKGILNNYHYNELLLFLDEYESCMMNFNYKNK